jgi:hypothetical protein
MSAPDRLLALVIGAMIAELESAYAAAGEPTLHGRGLTEAHQRQMAQIMGHYAARHPGEPLLNVARQRPFRGIFFALYQLRLALLWRPCSRASRRND